MRNIYTQNKEEKGDKVFSSKNAVMRERQRESDITTMGIRENPQSVSLSMK